MLPLLRLCLTSEKEGSRLTSSFGAIRTWLGPSRAVPYLGAGRLSSCQAVAGLARMSEKPQEGAGIRVGLT